MGEAARKQGDGIQGRSPQTGERPDLAARVLRYFREHATAMDSVDGIARFWIREPRSVVERCLADLHGRGLLHRRVIAGTDFYSLQRDVPAPRPITSRAISETPRKRVATRGRILIVDDDDSVRKFIVQTLTEEGHSVAAAENGKRAIAMFDGDPFDLVVTDLMMPGISGMDVLQAVKRRHPSTEVIVVTGHASLESAVEALRNGAYDLITKPLDDIELLHRGVGRALERQRLEMENRLLVANLQARNVELKETVARLAAVNDIGKATTRLLDLRELYETLVRLVSEHLKVRRVSVLISEPESDTMALVASVGIADREALGTRVRVGEGIAGRVAASQSPLLVPDIEKSELKELRTGGRYNTGSFMITPLTISYPIRFQRRRVGVINVADKISGDPFSEQDLEFLSTLASQLAVAIENARLVKKIEGGFLSALASLIQAREDSRPETFGRTRRVMKLSTALAAELGLDQAQIEILLRAAALHDIGLLSEPAGEAAAPGSSDRAAVEWNAAAALAAERILSPIASLREAREIILRSLDRFDAMAIPFGAEHPTIPLESRILAVCEVYVRLTPVMNAPELYASLLQRLRRWAGMKLDPEVVEALGRLIEREGEQ